MIVNMKSNYMSASEAAKKLDISRQRIRILAKQSRIRGQVKIGNQWCFPVPVRILPPKK